MPPKAPRCCSCNSSGRCLNCSCVKGKRRCKNCVPSLHERCGNTALPGELTREVNERVLDGGPRHSRTLILQPLWPLLLLRRRFLFLLLRLRLVRHFLEIRQRPTTNGTRCKVIRQRPTTNGTRCNVIASHLRKPREETSTTQLLTRLSPPTQTLDIGLYQQRTVE